jgi:nitroreductase
MNARTLFERRFSCRSFDATPLDRETVEAVLEAARWAPNGGNLQPWRFVVVLDSIRRNALAGAAYGQDFLAQAPVVGSRALLPAGHRRSGPEHSPRRHRSRTRELLGRSF